MRSPAEILYNFHWVMPGEAARGARAYAGFLGPFLGARGVRAVINLRGPNEKYLWWRREKRVCAGRGIAHFDCMLNSRRLPTRQMLVNFLAAFDRAKTPLLLKCSGGQDRSSFASALLIIHRKGWGALDEANAQFAAWPYLHRPKKHQRWLKHFLEFARAESHARPLAQWIAEDYTPQMLKTWLDTRGLRDSYRGHYDKPGTAPGI
jgi:hypothetical protein